MDNTASISDVPQLHEKIRAAAHSADSWDVVHRPHTASAFPERVLAAREALRSLEKDLASLPAATAATADKQPAGQDSPLIDLQKNVRLLRAAIAGVSGSPRVVARLPRILHDSQDDEPRIAAASDVYLRAVTANFSTPTFLAFIDELQTHEALGLWELWNFPSFLSFALCELLLVEARMLLNSPVTGRPALIAACLGSLRDISHSDWTSIIEPLIKFDAILRQDPAGAYGNMDFESRESYRKSVASIARHSDQSELNIALTAVALAREALNLPSEDPRIHQRRIHVGYYLTDKGFLQLADRVGFHPPLVERVRRLIRSEADDFYIVNIQLITIFIVAAVVSPLLGGYSLKAVAIVSLLMLLPAMQDAVELVNNAVTAIFGPKALPKLDFSKNIPVECTTLVAVPTLLLNEDQVRGLVAELEVRFLANRDPNLHFGLLSDLPDSVAKPRENDSHALVELAIQLIDELNAKYNSPHCGSFVLLHRRRVFNTRQGVWMGWERKRGKIIDLNKFLVGSFDAFPIKAGKIEALSRVRYVITLDSDTQLPRGTAAQLIGAMAHPLNQAVIDPKLRIVTSGYGILQPRVGITVQSASRSRLATLYSGQSGFDIYTRAVSDAYQDLFGEGIFTGKGIYEVAVFHALLDRRFPRNALLSHDLIEGAYTRAGLATDIELIDDYPSHYSAYSRRKHRWVRGDWQIVQWMFSRVPEESGRWVPNPISAVSRWKIFDNLRRSLVEPFTFILFLAGWFGLSGGPVYWTVALLSLLAFPAFVGLGFGLLGELVRDQKSFLSGVFSGFFKALFIAFLNLVFLPHQTLLALDAIVRSLVRRFVTGERLLEWETAAQSELRSSSHTPVDRYLGLMPFISLGLAILVYFFAAHRNAILFAAPILLLWGLAYFFTAWLNRAPREQNCNLGSTEKAFVLAHALRTWRYFSQFGGERHNYLIPDNVEEDGLYEAARVSPTNLGLLLNARQVACELGFLTAPEFASLTASTLATVSKLQKYRGHLYNWYETESLKPLPPLTVSSVDSGNLVASLYTVRAGTLQLCRQPLLPRQLFAGLSTHWQLVRLQSSPSSPLAKFSLPAPAATVAEWIQWLPKANAALSGAIVPSTSDREDQWWLAETRRRITAILMLLHDYTPWLLPEYQALRELPDFDIIPDGDELSIDVAAAFCDVLDARLARTSLTLANDSSLLILDEQLRAALPEARRKLDALATALHNIAHQAENFAEETEFGFLVDPGRRLLSVGYDLSAQKLHSACYDILASEARIATFLSVARGDLPQQSWLSLGRGHTRAFSQFLLLSWTGTMFEYLMPALWMRSYPDTLIANTLTACVKVQRAFARSLNIPWGISESGFSRKDDAGHYQYQAFGIPQAALKFDATAGPVVSPYSSFLALGVDPLEALRNLHWMAKAGWVGAYGFYEAVDYACSPGTAVIVREWMAHHQGMSLLAMANLLRDNIVQKWFHANPLVRSTELLLDELPARKATLQPD